MTRVTIETPSAVREAPVATMATVKPPADTAALTIPDASVDIGPVGKLTAVASAAIDAVAPRAKSVNLCKASAAVLPEDASIFVAFPIDENAKPIAAMGTDATSAAAPSPVIASAAPPIPTADKSAADYSDSD